MSKVADASLLESPPEFVLPLQLAPKSSCDPVTLELLWPFPAEKPDDVCVREMFDDSYQTLAYDAEFGAVTPSSSLSVRTPVEVVRQLYL
jgi:hypothetical protein